MGRSVNSKPEVPSCEKGAAAAGLTPEPELSECLDGRWNLTGPRYDDRPPPNQSEARASRYGRAACGARRANEHDYALWEKRVDAMLTLLSKKGLMTVDELRRNIEGLGPDAYDRMTYYERWIYAVAQTMIQRGVVSIDELGRKIAEVEGRADVSP